MRKQQEESLIVEVEKTKKAHDEEKDEDKKKELNKKYGEQKKQLDTLREKVNAINESIQNNK